MVCFFETAASIVFEKQYCKIIIEQRAIVVKLNEVGWG